MVLMHIHGERNEDIHEVPLQYNHYIRMVYNHTVYTSSAGRNSQRKEINSRETIENMHSNSVRAKLMFYEKIS